MALAPGTRLGPYEILSALGAGGMGEVYQATDTNLKRHVAIKVLPASVAGDTDRLARFQREAEVLAALNHPNIAAIYGLEKADGTVALVMELVEGEDLSQRIARSAIPLDEALPIAKQIAGALEAAHEQGIVHRDLKPANIKVRADGTVKVLDFGLAKALGPPETGRKASSDLTNSPTITAAMMTRDGAILGTVAYMSPEQARGRAVDTRTDIWTFGCVLFEMLTGHAVFARDTATDTLAAIIEREPEWNALPVATPATVRRLLQRCLDKDTTRRLRHIGDARVELDDALHATRSPASANRVARRAGAWLATAAVAAVLGIGLYTWRARSGHEPARNPADQRAWVQLTRLSDAVSQPALSSDGRMLTFVRGAETFLAPGEIFVKMLPDGEAVQLTHDGARKMSPAFSPDNSQIAYTTGDGSGHWDTWMVSISGGQPHVWLPNASGLVWFDTRRILFSEIKNNDIHMAVATADESRAGERDVYAPPGDHDMAHRSYPSPDGKRALVAEMSRNVWQACRVVSMGGGDPGRPIGPPGAGCMSAAWSPDGNWMYVSSSSGGAFHIWRQRFPDGLPEQVTTGPTEEEGIAMAPDGRSFVTAVGFRQSAVWVHDSRGERQVSGEGYAYDPKFTADGRRLVYRILKGALPPSDPGELRVLDVESGRSEPLLPDLAVVGQLGRAYDISSDGQRIVVAASDAGGKRRLWLAPLDRSSSPETIPNVEGDMPFFAANGEIVFRAIEGSFAFAYRVHQDGTELRKAIEQPLPGISGFSRDGQWLMGRFFEAALPIMVAIPLRGGSPVPFAGGDASSAQLKWSADGNAIFVALSPTLQATGHTYAILLTPGQMFPPIPAGGFPSEAAIAKLPGARLIEGFDVAPGPVPDVYAYSRQTVQRNLYRIAIP